MDLLRRYARPREVLLEHEFAREQDFLDLVAELAGPDPTPLDLICARDKAAALWRYDRETGDASAVAATLRIQAYSTQRAGIHRDASTRLELKRITLASVKLADEMHAELKAGARGVAGGNVVPLRRGKGA